MESGSSVVGKDENKKKYHIYVEEYVLSYLRRESGSLELSEIYFYGSRQDNGRKFYVYGAGRDKGIAAFAEYEPLSELVCRLTQAGPVFLVRESDGECRTTGFQVFYDNNEAMQNYLLEWTGSPARRRTVEKNDVPEMVPTSEMFLGEEKKRPFHGSMSVQLCLILVILVAIVITSTDSYDKMEELNRSAREVFFAIENQEADGTSQDADALVMADDQVRDEAFEKTNGEADNEIVIERETGVSGNAEQEEKEAAPTLDADELEDIQVQDADSGMTEDDEADDSHTENSAMGEENVLKPIEESSGQADERKPTQEIEEENEEALSRSITRYYEVEQGDTLYTISQKIYGDISRVEKICEVNQISDPDKIRSGQRIILP